MHLLPCPCRMKMTHKDWCRFVSGVSKGCSNHWIIDRSNTCKDLRVSSKSCHELSSEGLSLPLLSKSIQGAITNSTAMQIQGSSFSMFQSRCSPPDADRICCSTPGSAAPPAGRNRGWPYAMSLQIGRRTLVPSERPPAVPPAVPQSPTAPAASA
jgi:hypothetical protein